MKETTNHPNRMNHRPSGSIQPSYTVNDIFGDYIYCAKLYAKEYEHFGNDFASLEALTGRELGVIGDVPAICHKGTVTEPAVALLEKAGLRIPSTLYTYSTDEEYVKLLKKLREQDKKIIFQYPHPKDVISPSLFWVDPNIIAYLSDKKNIPELVPAEHVSPRRIMSFEQILAEKPKLPIVLKTGDGRPTAGGSGVKLVKEEKQLEEIDETFGDLSNIIVEDYVENHKNISVHYFVDKNREIKFLGKSEQLVNEDGNYRSSWISVHVEPELEKVVKAGFEVMKKIAEKGYFGIAGFDVLMQDDNFYFIDLNIRFNASTCGLLLHESIEKNYGKDTIRLCNFEWPSKFSEVLPIIEEYLDNDQFVPLSLLDGDYLTQNNQVSKIVGLVIGNSDEEVENIIQDMTRKGLLEKE